MIPKMTPKVSPVSQKRINKVLAIIQYISGLFDSQLIVKQVVFRGKQHKGGFINPRWRLYIYIYIYVYVYMYTYIYIYIYMYMYICGHARPA